MDGKDLLANIDLYLEFIKRTKNTSTYKTYKTAVNMYTIYLKSKGLKLRSTNVSDLEVTWASEFVKSQEHLSPRSKIVHLMAIRGLYNFIRKNVNINFDLTPIKDYSAQLYNSVKRVSPMMPADQEITLVIGKILSRSDNVDDIFQKLVILRDKSIILVLRDSGIRTNEVCKLRRGDVDYKKRQIKVNNTHKSISQAALNSIGEYLDARNFLDENFSNDAKEHPLFARHDHNSQKKLNHIGPASIQKMFQAYALEALGVEGRGKVTPRSLQDYFANKDRLLRLVDLLHPEIVKRCRNIFEIGEYDDAILNAMIIVEETVRKKAGLDYSVIGVDLVHKAMNVKAPLLKMRDHPGEQIAADSLYSGALGMFKNPRSHKFPGLLDPVRAYECLAFASLLIRMLDDIEDDKME